MQLLGQPPKNWGESPASRSAPPSPLGRALRFVRANGGWRHTLWIAARKVVRCGPADALAALLGHVAPAHRSAARRYRRFLRLHEEAWAREQAALPCPARPSFAPFAPDAPLPDADWVYFALPSDRLRPFSLATLARAVAAAPNAVALYTDCDYIDARGHRTAPDFKPAWSPDTLRSWFYVHGLSAFRRDLLADLLAEAPVPALDDDAIYTLWLRFTTRWLALSRDSRPPVLRIPGILLHRTSPSSKETRAEGGSGHESRTETNPQITYFQSKLAESPLVSLIIPSRDHAADLRACLDSIRERTTYPHYEMVVVDNGSTTRDALALLRAPALRVVHDPAPFNFSRLCNGGVRAATGDILLFLNNDTEVLSPNWLERMVSFATLPHVGAVGPRLLYPDGTLQHSGVAKVGDGPTHVFSQMPEDTPNPRVQLPGDWSAVTGACLMVERHKFDEVGGFDETYPVAFNDTDLCFRLLEAGYFNVLEPRARLLHKEFATRGSDRQDPARRAAMFDALRRLYERHPALRDDPGYNPNLSTDLPDWMPQN